MIKPPNGWQPTKVHDETAAHRREFRGLIFGADGKIMSRRYHKFWNLNEREEVMGANVDWTQPFVIMEKLDGSMISPIYVDGSIRLTTKAGITEVSKWAEVFVARQRHYLEFMDEVMHAGYTPIFEFCSRKNRVVIDHPKERLVLTALRNNVTGKYTEYFAMQGFAIHHNIDVVKAWKHEDGAKNLLLYLQDLQRTDNTEGVVIRFDNGHMLKVKTEWYSQIHRAKENLIWEKNVIKMILDGHTDDVKAFLLEDDKKKLTAYESKVLDGLKKTAGDISEIFNTIRQNGMDRKTYALTVMPNYPKVYSSIIFKCWDTEIDVYDALCKHIYDHMTTQTRVDNTRGFWGNHKWDYGHGE